MNLFDLIIAASCFSPPKKFLLKKKSTLERIKVLHLHTRAIVGGSGVNVLLTLEGIPQEKFSGHLACGTKGAQEQFLDQVKSKNIIFHPLTHLANQINPIEDFIAFLEIVRLIKKERYTIVHTHNSKAGILGRLAAKFCGVPIIIHTIHSCEFHYEGVGVVARRLFIFLEKQAARFTDHFIAISEHLKEEFVKYRIASVEKISVIYSGIEIEKFKIPVDKLKKCKELGLDENDFVVGIIARLEKGKGHKKILEAIPLIANEKVKMKFLFVGDGPLKQELVTEVENSSLQRCVFFLGLRRDVAEILQIVDVVCLPSSYEGMGRVILEAQAAGKAIVATRVGGIPNIVLEGKTAILIEPNDNHALAEALLRLVHDSKLKDGMGRAGAAFVNERFSAGTMVRNINALYEKLFIQSVGSVND